MSKKITGPRRGRFKKKAKGDPPGPVRDITPAPPTALVPIAPEPVLVFQVCSEHPEVSFRAGGFCEKCYGEQTVARTKQLDDALHEEVITQVQTIIQRVLASEDMSVVERFLGRVLARFDRPKEAYVHGTLKAVHLHAPVDFGKEK